MMSIYINGTQNGIIPPVLTTLPYPHDDVEGLTSSIVNFSAQEVPVYRFTEAFDGVGISQITGILNYPLKSYTVVPPDDFQGTGISQITGILKPSLVSYTVTPLPPELLDADPAQIVEITSQVVLAEYSNYPAEAVDIGGYQITGGSLI